MGIQVGNELQLKIVKVNKGRSKKGKILECACVHFKQCMHYVGTSTLAGATKCFFSLSSSP